MNRLYSYLRVCVLISLGAACATAGHGSNVLPKATGSFTRFTAAFVDAREQGVDSGWGGFAAVGSRFGDGEASAEIGQVRFAQSEALELREGLWAASFNLRITSAMVGGRYGVRLGRTDRVRLLFGGMVGFAHVAFSGREIDGEYVYAIKASSNGTVWAADLGVAVAISEKLELNAGYRYVGLGSTEWQVDGEVGRLPQLNANIYSVGLGYKW